MTETGGQMHIYMQKNVENTSKQIYTTVSISVVIYAIAYATAA